MTILLSRIFYEQMKVKSLLLIALLILSQTRFFLKKYFHLITLTKDLGQKPLLQEFQNTIPRYGPKILTKEMTTYSN